MEWINWKSSKSLDNKISSSPLSTCLLYTSDAADDLLCVDLGGRRIIKKKTQKKQKKEKSAAIHASRYNTRTTFADK